MQSAYIYDDAPRCASQFTGKERDAETGLDYFGARYYGSNMGRFMTPDPLMFQKQKLLDPQQWNMYQYARDNPLRFIDPTGMKVQVEDSKALERIRSTVPEKVRASVKLDKDNMIDKKALNKVKSNDPNVVALKQLVNNSKTLEVATANGVQLGANKESFKYESVETVVSDLKNKGIEVDPKNITATNFLGYTQDAKDTASGNARVILSDGTGSAASAPGIDFAVTSAHELYGHGLPQITGQPWQHDGGGPVDTNIIHIEQHTRDINEPK